MIETDRVKMTEWRLKVWGDSTGWHRPGLDFIFSRLFNGVLDVKLADGEIMQARMPKDMPTFRGLALITRSDLLPMRHKFAHSAVSILSMRKK
ncbi:hypothetical protein [Pseudodonghicola sp.]|uniref:hypothetical protein n=1 Tax=Pseudodonghicola sp. TaxID=1969463 RepID=UPI003A9741AD